MPFKMSIRGPLASKQQIMTTVDGKMMSRNMGILPKTTHVGFKRLCEEGQELMLSKRGNATLSAMHPHPEHFQ